MQAIINQTSGHCWWWIIRFNSFMCNNITGLFFLFTFGYTIMSTIVWLVVIYIMFSEMALLSCFLLYVHICEALWCLYFDAFMILYLFILMLAPGIKQFVYAEFLHYWWMKNNNYSLQLIRVKFIFVENIISIF